jgi:hypothetical protein
MNLQEVVAKFGAAAKAKLSNPAVKGEPEDQLRAPMESLFADIAALCGLRAESLTLVGETAVEDETGREQSEPGESERNGGLDVVVGAADPERQQRDQHRRDEGGGEEPAEGRLLHASSLAQAAMGTVSM